MPIVAPEGGCTIRMYRQGLGDCFLLAFGGEKGLQKYMLIDCGVLLGTDDATEQMKSVVANIHDATGGKLEVLAVTHEHWDHVSGFIQAQEEFKALEVGELWFSWTEDPDNRLARDLRKRRNVALQALRQSFSLLGKTPSLYASRIQTVAEFFGPGLGTAGKGSSTEAALDSVKKLSPKHRYCTPGDDPLNIRGLPGVNFFVLGPPADPKWIRKSNPSSRPGEVYLSEVMADNLPFFLRSSVVPEGESERADAAAPFNPAYKNFLSEKDAHDLKEEYESEPWRNIDSDWLGAAGELALQLDAHTNNTSLVLAIELSPGGKVLLFPGDAQVGNWLSWDEVNWSGSHKDLTAADLLSRTVLYKVGHHGSHNATLQDKGLERMVSSKLTALIPVDQQMAKKKKWQMPYKPLYSRLKELSMGKVILSDEGLPEATRELKNFLKTCKGDDPLWIDVTIKG